jgi:hypothetical protein
VPFKYKRVFGGGSLIDTFMRRCDSSRQSRARARAFAMAGLAKNVANSIWHAFHALSTDKTDTVAKSKLKVIAFGQKGFLARPTPLTRIRLEFISRWKKYVEDTYFLFCALCTNRYYNLEPSRDQLNAFITIFPWLSFASTCSLCISTALYKVYTRDFIER